SFYAGYVSVANPGSLLGTAPLNGSTPNQAVLNVPFAGPGEVVTAVYNGDSTYASSVSAPVTIAAPCTQTLTGVLQYPIHITSGFVCVTNATVVGSKGSITVGPTGSLYVANSSIANLTIHGKATVCGSNLLSITVSSATGLVVV